MTTLKQKIAQRHSPKSEYDRYKKIYEVIPIAGIMILTLSAILSAKYYQTHCFASWGESGFLLGGIISLAVSLLIGWLSTHAAELYFEQARKKDAPNSSRFDLFSVLLVVAFVWNVYADWNGSSEVAPIVYNKEKPSNGQALTMDKEITDLRKKQEAILAFYGWCSVHSSKHIKDGREDCKHLVRPTTYSGIRGAKKYGYDQESDREAYKALEQQIAAKSETLKTLNKDYTDTQTAWEEKVEKAKGTLQGLSVVLTLIAIGLTAWRMKFGTSVAATTPVTDETEGVTEETTGVTAQELVNAIRNANPNLSDNEVLDLLNAIKGGKR